MNMKINRLNIAFFAVFFATLIVPLLFVQAKATISEEKTEPLFTEEELELMFSSAYIHGQSRETRDVGDISTFVNTSDGTPVNASINVEFSDEEIVALQCSIEDHYSNLEYIAPPSRKYNCHSYAWYDQSESNTYWISFPDGFVFDKHTVPINRDELQRGDIVVYIAEGCYAHSAVVDYIDDNNIIYCESKWGYYGVYGHAIDNVPDSYKDDGEIDVEFYRYTQGWHNYSAFSIGDDYHLLECAICSNFTSEPHSKYFSNINYGTHTVACYYCSYTQTSAHIFQYRNINNSTHKAICRICNYSQNEPHMLNQDRNQCIYCLRTGDVIGMIPNRKKEKDSFVS